ncbi:D-alanyl-D-alanine carboxypeptidase/D-alanyl-D-alanine-endopeptidase [Candidatus Sumerlaeota bacterium]|nr:D-alanyl-D-alanine carboxypeptidase/D-alanyl-D-alanine-endopeptidase [Candidatus Sumerlaeota bacterium]
MKNILKTTLLVLCAVLCCFATLPVQAAPTAKKKATASSTEKKSKSKTTSSRKSSTKKKAKKEATPTPAPTPVTEADIPTAIERILRDNRNAGIFGVEVARLENGKVLYQNNNANRGFIPASVRKVMTTCLALDQLGPDFRYQTYLMKTGSVSSDGTLNGDLVILPQGDPTFSSLLFRKTAPDWVYRDWVDKVKQQGIRHIKGGLKIDCSDWDMGGLKPDWPSRMLNDTYANFPSPLTVKENLMEVVVKPGAPGQPGIVEFRPDAQGYPIINKTVTGKGSAFKVKRGTDNRIQLMGNVNSVKALTLPSDNPSLYAAAVFRSLLKKSGIDFDGTLTIERRRICTPSRENVVAYYQSPALSDILTVMNKHSENHLAEQIYVSIGAVKGGKAGYATSRVIERNFLKRAGVDITGFYGADGCGLSEANRVSPHQLVQLLTYMVSQPSFSVFYNTLPKSGIDGTLKSRMQGYPGRIIAKTGTINGVVTLSGYVQASEKQTYVFAILVNKASRSGARAVEDRICETLVRATP